MDATPGVERPPATSLLGRAPLDAFELGVEPRHRNPIPDQLPEAVFLVRCRDGNGPDKNRKSFEVVSNGEENTLLGYALHFFKFALEIDYLFDFLKLKQLQDQGHITRIY